MKLFNYTVVAALLAMFLVGCSTYGKRIEPVTHITINNNTGTINISPDLATASGDNTTTPNNAANVPVDADLNLDPGQMLNNAIDTVTNDELESAATELAPIPVIKPEGEKVKPLTGDGQTISMKPEHGKSYTWLPWTGEELAGGEILFEFDGCGEMVVEDPTMAYAPNGNVDDHQQMFYFSGNTLKIVDGKKTPQRDTHPLGLASVWTAPGCVSTKVTLHR